MTITEYAELSSYINSQTNKFNNISIYRVHSSYDPNSDRICKISLKINYTKDGTTIPAITNGKLPKNITERSVNFRGADCNIKDIKEWLDNFMKEKGSIIRIGGK